MKSTESLERLYAVSGALVVLYFLAGHSWLLWVVLALIVLGVLRWRVSYIVAETLGKFFSLIERLITTLVLGLVFFLVLTPVSAVYRWFSGKRESSFFYDHRDSYFTETATDYAQEFFERIW